MGHGLQTTGDAPSGAARQDASPVEWRGRPSEPMPGRSAPEAQRGTASSPLQVTRAWFRSTRPRAVSPGDPRLHNLKGYAWGRGARPPKVMGNWGPPQHGACGVGDTGAGPVGFQGNWPPQSEANCNTRKNHSPWVRGAAFCCPWLCGVCLFLFCLGLTHCPSSSPSERCRRSSLGCLS